MSLLCRAGQVVAQGDQLVRVDHEADPLDVPVDDIDGDRGIECALEPGNRPRLPVEFCKLECPPVKAGRVDPGQEAGYLSGSGDGVARGFHLAAAVGVERGLRGELGQHCCEVTALAGGQEPFGHAALGNPVSTKSRAACLHVLACPVSELAYAGRRTAQCGCNVLVWVAEDLPQHEHRPFRRRQRLQHHQHRCRGGLGHHRRLGRIRLGRLSDQRLRQPRAHVELAPCSDRAQPVQRQAGRGAYQIRPRVGDLRAILS